MPFLTPNNPPIDLVSRRIVIPLDPDWISLVSGAVSMLTYSSEWEKSGDLTPEEAAQYFKQIFLEFARSDDMYIGAVVSYATDDPPNGILQCNGDSFLRVDYPLLYSKLSAPFIIDADTFIVPDLRGRFILAAGQGTGLTARFPNEQGGEEVHTLTIPEMPTHTHGYSAAVPAIINGGLEAPAAAATAAAAVTDAAGGGLAHENMPPFYVLRYGIIAR